MAPNGSRSSAAAAEPTIVPDEPSPPKGPHAGEVSVARQYTVEQQLRRMQREIGCDPSREDNYRLQGVQLIENVRESLQLSVLPTGLAPSAGSSLTTVSQTGQDVQHSVHILPQVPSQIPRRRVQLPRCRPRLAVCCLQGGGYHKKVQGDSLRRVQSQDS